MRSQNRRFATAAVLTTLLAMSAAHAQVADGGASSDAGAAPTALDAAALVAEVGAPAPVTKAPAPPPTVDQIATMMLATAPPIEAEPPRPITRRLWFWLAVTGAVVAGVLVGVAVHNPNHTRPDCPPDYVCPP